MHSAAKTLTNDNTSGSLNNFSYSSVSISTEATLLEEPYPNLSAFPCGYLAAQPFSIQVCSTYQDEQGEADPLRCVSSVEC